jgi:hypothetical protein
MSRAQGGDLNLRKSARGRLGLRRRANGRQRQGGISKHKIREKIVYKREAEERSN